MNIIIRDGRRIGGTVDRQISDFRIGFHDLRQKWLRVVIVVPLAYEKSTHDQAESIISAFVISSSAAAIPNDA